MEEIYKENIEKDDFADINKFDDYDLVTPEKFNDVLLVDRDNKNSQFNRKLAGFQSGSSGTEKFLNMPSALDGITTLFYRDVLYRSSAHVLIKITESWPVTGRIWTNFYNTNKWGGWKCIQMQKGYDYPVMRSAFGNIGNDDIVTVFGTVSLQKLSDTKANLFITARLDRNEGTDPANVKIFDLKKILSLAGIKDINSNFRDSVVLVNVPGENKTDYEGYGYGCVVGDVNAEKMLYIGRNYTNKGNFGAWGATAEIYRVGTVYHISLYNAIYEE